MEKPVLTDPSVFPSDDLIFSILGHNKIHWLHLLEQVHLKYPGAEEVWHYYNDGKSWLFRIIRKKKTLFWIGLVPDTFRITFYFGEKSFPLIEKSSLPEALKQEFFKGKSFGRFKGISILVESPEDVVNALLLSDIRVKT